MDVLLLAALLLYFRRHRTAVSLNRAVEMQSHIRVVKQQPPAVLASLLDSLFSSQVKLERNEAQRGPNINGVPARFTVYALVSFGRGAHRVSALAQPQQDCSGSKPLHA